MIAHRFIPILLLLLSIAGQAQQKYWVFFTDKAGVEFEPHAYFDQKAIARRVKNGIPLNQPSDYPVKSDYIDRVKRYSDSIGYASRWFNGVTAWLNPEQLYLIEKLPFVRGVQRQTVETHICALETDDDYTDMHPGEMKLARAQINRMEGDLFRAEGITGEGIRVAIFDAGFKGVDYKDAFDHIRAEDRIIDTYDFVKQKQNVYKYHSHGTMVLSNIAGIYDGLHLGVAPDAEFLLARTEKILSEGMIDEESWLAAVEWADKNGADVINSSLGYTNRRYFKENMDGETSLIARAANMAVSKGILVVNSAGNEGDDNWRLLGSPADADSVLTVGALNPWTNTHTSWASFGPTADKRMKPNVTAFGHTIAIGKDGPAEVHGTSFSSPLTAGFAACVIQLMPDKPVMEIFREIEKSGDLYPYFDYAHGYGVPQASYFLEPEKEVEPTFEIIESGDSVSICVLTEHFYPSNIVRYQYYSGYQDSEPLFENGILSKKGIRKDYEYNSTHIYDYHYSAISSGVKDRPR